MEVFHLEILGFPETEASEDLLQAQPEAHFWERATNLYDFKLIFSRSLMVIIQRRQLCSTVAGNLGGIAAAKFATIVAGSTNYINDPNFGRVLAAVPVSVLLAYVELHLISFQWLVFCDYDFVTLHHLTSPYITLLTPPAGSKSIDTHGANHPGHRPLNHCGHRCCRCYMLPLGAAHVRHHCRG